MTMWSTGAWWVCLSAWVATLRTGILVLAQDPSSTSDSPVAVPTICGDIVGIANEDLENNWLFYASDVYQCLTSVPFLDAVALRYIDYYNTTLDFQSTLSYLATPPNGYQQPGINVRQVLDEIKANVTTGRYSNEYDFEATLWSLVQRMHDSHVSLDAGTLAAFLFGSPYDIMSVSVDGKQAPKVYIKEDVIYSASQGYTPSAITTINGEDVVPYLERFASIQSVGMLEPHADWNQLMYSPVQDILGSLNLFGWNAVLYPGDNLTFAFENGTTVDTSWLAYYLNREQTGPLTTGGDFYNYFVLGFLPASFVSNVSDSTSNSTGNDDGTASDALTSWANQTSAYPDNPTVVQPGLSIGGSGGILTGYFLDDISTAVLSIPNFDEWGDSAQNFSTTTAEFIQRAQAAGLTRIVLDLQQNYGGDPILAFDMFQQFFPNIAPYAGSRRRSHPLGNILGATITDFWNNLSPQDPEYDYDEFYAAMASDEFVVTDRLNAATGQNFTSWSEFYGPVSLQNDQFSLVERYNLSSADFTSDAADGFALPPASGQSAPFDGQNIILLTDGICSSTCSLFVELMTHQAGVRTVVVGGRPTTGPMQAASGSRGARSLDAYDLDDEMVFAGLVNTTANTTLPQVREQAIFTYAMTINLRDQIREYNDVPLQFQYVAANCRIYYSFANAYNMSRLWHDAVAAIFTDPSLCVAGSTTAASRPPPSNNVRSPSFAAIQSGIKSPSQYAFGPGIGITDGLARRASGTFSPCNSNCGSQCIPVDCGGTVTSLCAPDCQNPGGPCGNGAGTCQQAKRQAESKLNTVGKRASSKSKSSKGFYVGICMPNDTKACPAGAGSGLSPPS